MSAGASIRYTTDGSPPSEIDGTLYSGPVTIAVATTLKAIAFIAGVPNSSVATASYTITSDPPVATPTFSPAPGAFAAAQSVTIASATSGASIRYTSDGSTPTPTTGTVYSGAVAISTTTTLKAIAYKSGLPNSAVASGTFTISIPVAPPIAFEAEDLAHAESGGTYSLSFEDTASGGQFASPNITDPSDPLFPVRRRFVTFSADGVPPPPTGEYIEFTLPAIPAGTYNFVLRYKSHPTNRGVMRLTIDGATVGADLNQLSTATFKPQDVGVVRFAAAGDHVARLTVVGKTNVTTTPWNLTADVVALVPDTLAPVISALPNLTVGATDSNGATVTFNATATDNKDGAVSVTFTPASGSVFPIGTTLVTARATDFAGNIATKPFTVTVTPSYASWSAEQGLTPANSAFTVDVDGDGIPNLMEYFLGLRPTVSDPLGQPTGKIEDDEFVFRFNRAKNVTNVTYRVLVSSDLVTWTPASPGPVLESENDLFETFVVILPLTSPRMFARVEVTAL